MARTAPDGGTAAVGGAVFDDGSSVCGGCGERFDEANIEFFELTGTLQCAECVEAFWDAQETDDGLTFISDAREWADFDPEA